MESPEQSCSDSGNVRIIHWQKHCREVKRSSAEALTMLPIVSWKLLNCFRKKFTTTNEAASGESLKEVVLKEIIKDDDDVLVLLVHGFCKLGVHRSR